MYLLCIKIMINKKESEDFISNLEEKAATKVRGQIWDFLIAENDSHVMFSFFFFKCRNNNNSTNTSKKYTKM